MRSENLRRNVDVGLSRYIQSVYQYMIFGLAVTGAVALLPMFLPLESMRAFMSLSWVAIFGTLGIAIYFSFALHRISSSTAQMLFWVYATLMGVALTSIFAVYRAESIAKVFLVASGAFGATSVYGYMTQKDLTSVGSFCMMGLFGLIIASLVNFFTKSSALDFALSIIGVAVFIGLTAYDTQKIRQMYYEIPQDDDLKKKMAIFGALTLYLDMVNLFLSLLRLMGDRK